MSRPPADVSRLTPGQRDLLLRLVRQRRGEAPAPLGIARRRDRTVPAPLSFSQQRLWFLDQLQPGSSVYNIAVAIRIEGRIRPDLLRAAIGALLRRHESLRTTVQVLDGQPVQAVSPPSEDPADALPVVDLGGLDALVRERLATELCRRQAARPFDLARGPLLRRALLRVAEERLILSLVFHHIVSDLWSVGVFIREMTAVYTSLEEARAAPLPGLPIQYGDYAAWQREQLRGERLQREIEHWRRELAGAPTSLDLATDRPRPPVLEPRGAALPWQLPAASVGSLRQLGDEGGATLFMTMLAAYSVLLARFSGQEDLLVGSPVANRPLVELEGLIGFFVNLLVLRADLRGGPGFPELLGRVKGRCLQALAHQELPFEQLVDDLGLERDLSQPPLVQAALALQNVSLPSVERPDFRFDVIPLAEDTTQFDLSLVLWEHGGELRGRWGYRVQLLEPSTAERISRSFTVLLAGLCACPERPVWEVPLLGESERRQLLRQGRRAWPAHPFASLPARVAAVARRLAQAAAAVGPGGEILSYGELVARAGRVAAGLRQLGVAPEVRVAILLERSPELLVAIVGVLAAGGACLLLDPGRERRWLGLMLERSGCSVALTRADLLRYLPEHGAEEVLLERLEAGDHGGGEGWERIDPESLAFLVQTAGPRRQPRLAGLPHRGVVAWVEAWRRRLGPENLRAMVADSAPETADGVLDLMLPLCLGGCLINREATRDASLRSATPSRLAADVRLGGAGKARAVRAFGEVLGESLRARLHAAGVEDVVDSFSSALGGIWPAEWLDARVLGPSDEPVPIGVPGELWLGGEGLARGLEGDAARTAERFLPDPFGDRPGGRRVHTGDRARWQAGGRLEILGGVERRVRVRGMALDLGRIEELLAEHPGVLRAVAVLQGEGEGARLVAHALSAGPDAPTPEELRAFLRLRLPEPLVPRGVAVVEELPRTRTGCVDVEALRRVESDAPRDAATPRTEADGMLIRIWSELLGVEAVGLHDNFFQLGGDSILALQMVARIRQAGWSATPRQIFRHQSIAALARVIERLRVEAQAADEACSAPIPLTPIQRWFFAQDMVRPQHWNQSVLLKARRPLAPRGLERAMGAVIACHGALRLRFRRAASGWTQWIDPTGTPGLVRVNLSALPASRGAAALAAAAASLQGSLDLGGPVMRVALFQLAAGEAERLLWIVHHLAIDAVSWRILLADLDEAYRQAEEGREPRLAPEPTPFHRWAGQLAEHRRDPRPERMRKVWSDLADRIPPGAPRAAEGSEGETERVVVSLPEEETRALLRPALGPEGMRTDALLLTALLAAWRRWTGESALYLHLEGHGRDDPIKDSDLSRTVGWLTALTPVLLDGPGQEDLEAMLAGVRQRLDTLPSGIELGLAEGILPTLPRPPVLFNNLGQLDQALGRDTLWAPAAESSGPSRHPGERRHYPLEANAGVIQGRFHLELRSGPGEPLQGLAEAFLIALRALVGRRRFAVARHALAPLQSGILFHSLLAPGSGIYITQLSCLLRGELDLAAFGAAWRRLIQRHSALRTRFAWEELGEPVEIEEADVELPLAVEDWMELGAAEQERHFGDLLREDRRRGFVLSRAPLLRLRLVRLGSDAHRFLLSLHHLLSDGWSLAILMHEGLALYEAEAHGADLDLPAPRPYRDYIRWLEERPAERSRDFWRRRLAGFTAATPIRLGPETAAAAHDADPAERSLLLPAAASSAVRHLARRCQVTLYTVLVGAFAFLLRRLSGCDDVVFGTVVSGRPATLAGMESMVGCFINTIPTRVSTAGDMPLAAWLRALHAHWLETEEHQHTPLSDIAAWSEVGPGKPLFSSILVFENYPVQRSVQEWRGGLEIEDLRVGEQTNYPFNLLVVPGERILLHVQTDRRSVEAAAVLGAVLYVETLLGAMPAEPETRLPDLPLLTTPERHQLLVEGSKELVQGFWRRPGLTAERFIPDPFAEEPGARLYRSGERGRRLPDGSIVPLRTGAPVEAAADLIPLRPRDETERKLAAIWEDLLGRAGVGVRDNFFAGGGHSLLALRLMSRIEQELGAALPLSALFRAPTIEQLALQIVAQREAPRTEALVSFRARGRKPPLFFVHPVGGSVFCYQALAGRLGTDQPFFGLQDNEQAGEATIEEMAASYLVPVREVQPRGPYQLGGWSLGGVIAFEMARQLWADGETVALLALVDAPPAERTERLADPPDGGAWVLRFAADIAGLEGRGSSLPAGEDIALDPEARLQWLHELARKQGAIPLDLGLSRFRRQFEIFRRNIRALAGYSPRAVPVNLLFIRCGGPSAAGGDPTRGWCRYASGAEAHILEADHYSVLREPHVAWLARLLEERMESAAASPIAGSPVSPAV